MPFNTISFISVSCSANLSAVNVCFCVVWEVGGSMVDVCVRERERERKRERGRRGVREREREREREGEKEGGRQRDRMTNNKQ